MVSYASVVLSFLILVGPVMVLRGLAPDLMTPWAAASLLSGGLFVIWLAIQTHDAFTCFRYHESVEETQNLAFLGEEGFARTADAEQTTVVREPEKMTEVRPYAAAVAQGSPVS